MNTYVRGARSNATDEARFIGQATDEARQESEMPTVTDSLVWDGMYDGAIAETDWNSSEDFTFDPDHMRGY